MEQSVGSLATSGAQGEPSSKHIWWSPLHEFGIHVIVGSLIFVGIVTPAFGLDLFVRLLVRLESSDWLIHGAKGVEMAAFGVDAMLYVWFLLMAAWKAGSKFSR